MCVETGGVSERISAGTGTISSAGEAVEMPRPGRHCTQNALHPNSARRQRPDESERRDVLKPLGRTDGGETRGSAFRPAVKRLQTKPGALTHRQRRCVRIAPRCRVLPAFPSSDCSRSTCRVREGKRPFRQRPIKLTERLEARSLSRVPSWHRKPPSRRTHENDIPRPRPCGLKSGVRWPVRPGAANHIQSWSVAEQSATARTNGTQALPTGNSLIHSTTEQRNVNERRDMR